MKMKFNLKSAAALLAAASLVSPAFANDGADSGKGFPHLDHVFLIMMENHGYYQVLGNPNEPYLNSLIANKQVNLATNYFAVGHPSLTNYLEIVGGSNFGVRSDNSPIWGDMSCTTNLSSGIVNADNDAGNAPVPVDTGNVCPITGAGKDAETPAVDTWNEVSTPPSLGGTPPFYNYLADIDGFKSVPQAFTVGKSIADQLVEAGKTWKTYQESLPLGGAYGVDNSNGTASNLTDFTDLAPLTLNDVVALYAVKHNPFAYFLNVEVGDGIHNVVGFDGPRGLYADLATGNIPSFSYIVPNQCDDQHGKSGAGAFCAADPGSDGLQAGLNPGLIQQGDVTIQRLVEGIKASRVWHEGSNAIVIVWDENDYSGLTNPPAGYNPPQTLTGQFPPQNQNKVVLTVETNYCNSHGVQSTNYYNSFSLLRSLEAGFRLPCLNHSCDPGVSAMTDLFGSSDKGNW
jgi:phosphatidylinositol-3-phosphatase